MTNYADVASDIEKVKAEGFKTKEEVKNWAMKHGYGLAQLDDFVADWAKDAPEVEEVEEVVEEEEVVEDDEDDDDYDEEVEEEVEEDPAPTKKPLWKK